MRPWLGAALLVVLVVHALRKPRGELGDMLWVCNVATLVIAIGLVADLHTLVAMGFLLHAAWGAPGWLLELAFNRKTTVTGVAVHVFPVVAGALACAERGYPGGLAVASWAVFYAFVPIAYFATPPELNVNLAHAPWPPYRRFLPRLWHVWAFNAVTSFAAILVGDVALARIF